jgi:hypothetical protein
MVSHEADELGAVVEPAIPGQDGTGFEAIRLSFLAGFLGCVERIIKYSHAGLGMTDTAVGTIRSEKLPNPIEVFRLDRLAI